MRKLFGTGVAVVATVALFAASASAASPHFIRASASGPNSAGELDVSFKIAGLGDNVTLTVTASADATATWACKNGGDNFPADPKKEVVNGPVTASGPFTSGKNGQITGTLTLSPPSATTLDCPNGQTETLVQVSYTNVSVSAPGAGSESIPGTFSATLDPDWTG